MPDAKLAEALSSVDAETVRAAVRNLPDAQSEVLVLRFLEGRGIEEISAMIGIPVGTVNRMPSDFQLNGLALFGFCREAIRRRVKPLVQCFCKRREED